MLSVGAVSAALAASLAACGSSSGTAGKATLTLYNGQHASTTTTLVAAFTKDTGIKVNVRSGEDPELANQILQEGSASPADVVYTENSPALELLSEKGKLAPVDASTLADVPARYDSPHGDWVGVAGREVVLAYNPAKLSASDLPRSIMDVGGPNWHGKVGIAPSDADFQAIVAAVDKREGTAKTTAWLDGLKRNGEEFSGNTAILQAVNRGQIAAGIIYHYYYFRDQAESGANTSHVKMYYFGHQDPGAYLSVSGAAVLKSSKHQAEAQRLLAFLAGVQGQTVLAHSNDFEYPLNPSVPANPELKPLDQLGVPTDLGPGDVGDGGTAVTLLQQTGLL
ncbi:MAG TPA: iron ABC transporter substrate-binding protein [Mycobacteriales bacterium]